MSGAVETMLGAGAVTAAGGPVAGVLYLGGDLVGGLIGEILSAEPEGDARPFPLSRDAFGASCGSPIEADLSAFGLRANAGRSGHGVHPEYAEAFLRLHAIAALALGCGVDAREVEQARAYLVRAFNAGIEDHASGGDDFFACVSSERPTRGQVRAWLEAFAKKMAERCQSQRIAEVATVVGASLDEPVARTIAPFPWVLLALVLGAVGLVAWRVLA